MHIVADDPRLEQLGGVYPGELEYPLTDRTTAIPLAR